MIINNIYLYKEAKEHMSKGIDVELLSANIKKFIEIQYGEDVDESMDYYIDALIKTTLEDKKY